MENVYYNMCLLIVKQIVLFIFFNYCYRVLLVDKRPFLTSHTYTYTVDENNVTSQQRAISVKKKKKNGSQIILFSGPRPHSGYRSRQKNLSAKKCETDAFVP